MTSKPFIIISLFNVTAYRIKLLECVVTQLQKQTIRPYIALGTVGSRTDYWNDSEILKRVDQVEFIDGDAFIFQKEASYNAVVKKIPQTPGALIFLDGDIFPVDVNWIEKTLKALEKFPVIQCFSKLVHLGQSATEQLLQEKNAQFDPLTIKDSQTESYFSYYYLMNLRLPENGANGGAAYAMTREFYEAVNGIPWQGIVGSGAPTRYFGEMLMGEGYQPYFSEVFSHSKNPNIPRLFPKTRPGFLPCKLYHLWHGSMSNRHYKERSRRVKEMGFNPTEDLQLTKTGGIELTEKGLRLAPLLKEIFESHIDPPNFVNIDPCAAGIASYR